MLPEEVTKFCVEGCLGETAMDPKEGHTPLGFCFWSLLFSEPYLGSAHTCLVSCITQWTPAPRRALKSFTEIGIWLETEIFPDQA